jgi:hypothetical protein
MTFRSLLAAFMGVAAALLCGSATAQADDLYAADGIDLRWDTTLRYSNAIRISPQGATLLAGANADDGDRNFASGLVSDRLDLESQLDLALGDFGFHASAAGWYDTVYHNSTDNRSLATYNVTSVPASSFAPAVRDLEGQYAELDDAFVYGTFDIENMPVSARLGRQTVLWGESLFYDANSIASAQAPTDYTRTVTGQSSYSNNLYLPVTQLSLTAQLLPDVSLTVYDHLGARPSRQPGDGSYFSYVDFLGPGAGRLFLPSGQYLLRQADGKVSADGQYGVALRTSMDDIDIGFYVLQYNATDPQIITMASPGGLDPTTAGSYKLVYPKDIALLGASASTSLDEGTIAAEISLRRNAPLLAYPRGAGIAPDSGSASYLDYYLKGDLLHVQASAQLPIATTDIWDSANVSMEMAADDVTGLSGDASATSLERFAAKARLMFEPHYFQVLPNLDLTVPIGVGYNLTGRGFTYYAQNGGTGDFEIGVSALYRSVWKASLMMTGFIGAPDRQPLADRDIIAFSVERTF